MNRNNISKLSIARRVAASCLLLFAFFGNALAQGNDGQFVIKMLDTVNNQVHYLKHVKEGSAWVLDDATEFSPACLWYSGREYNLAGTNHNYYFVDDANNLRFLAAPLAENGSLYLSESLPETYLLSNSDQVYYFYDWDSDDPNHPEKGRGVARGHQYTDGCAQDSITCVDICGHSWGTGQCWDVFWVEYDADGKDANGEITTPRWELSDSTNYSITKHGARFRPVAITEYEKVIIPSSGGLSALSGIPAQMSWGGSAASLNATVADYTYYYIPAYTKYNFEDADHFYYDGSDHNSAPSQVANPVTTAVESYLWTKTGPGADYLTFSAVNIINPTLTYSLQNTQGHQSATVTLTVTYADGTTQTLSQDVLVLTQCQNPQQASAPSVNYENVTVSWYPTATKYKVYWKKHSDSNWNNSQDGITGTSFTIEGLDYNTQYDYVVCAYCGSAYLEISDDLIYSFKTKKAPNALIYGSVFGGGRMADVGGNTEVVIINCDSIGAVYGGNDIFGTVSGTDGSSITLGVDATHPDAVTYNNSNASSKVKVGDVYGGGNGYYKYNGTNFVGATSPTVSVEAGAHVTDMAGETVWINESGQAVTKIIPEITKTNIIVTNNAVKVDSIFGGAKNAFLTYTGEGDGSSIQVDGGTVYAVFGGNNYGGRQTGGKHHIEVNATKTNLTPNVASTATTGFGRNFGIRYLFGGGNKVQGLETDVVINGGQCDTVFAGGNSADVTAANVKVQCTLGDRTANYTYGNTYTSAIDPEHYSSGTIGENTITGGYVWNGTGVYNVRTLFGGNNDADMIGLPQITLTSGSVGTVYGGGNKGNMLANTDAPASIANDFGAPMQDNVAKPIYYSTHVEMNSANMLVDNLYGGCQMSNVKYSTWVEINDGHVGHVFGGCNISGDVGSLPRNAYSQGMSGEAYQLVNGATYVKASGGTIYKNLVAGGNGYYHCNDGVCYIDGIINLGHYIGDTIPTHNETHVMVSGNALVKGNVYAGGNMAPVGFINETCQNFKYRTFVGYASVRMTGGRVEGNVFGGSNMASIYGSNEVRVSGGKIDGALYGGNDQLGLVGQMTNRVLPSELNVASDQHTSLTALNVHTYVFVTGKPQINTVYGGGNGDYEYTEENYCNPNDQPVQSNTFVDINIDGYSDGDIQGGHINTVYGGGNGVTVTGGITVFLNVQGAQEGVEPESYDHVDVIFGGNNKGDLAILPDIILLHGQVNTVYGGCNEGGMAGDFTVDGEFQHVSSLVRLRGEYTAHDGTTVNNIPAKVSENVYGGCRRNIDVEVNGVTKHHDILNNTLILVEGGYYPDANLIGGCDISGEVLGTSQVVIKGGTVERVYGGGDGDYYYKEVDNGYGPFYEVYSDDTQQELVVDSLPIAAGVPYSAFARVDMFGGTVKTDVFGGSFAANSGGTYVNCVCGTVEGNVFGGNDEGGIVGGDVKVDIFGGVLQGVYGGCNVSGDILGQITVNVEHISNCPKSVEYVYGGGYDAAFTPDDSHSDANPQVNIKRGTVNKEVFGGGYGAGATVTAHPEVNIGGFGYDAIVGSDEGEGKTYGNVFGAGDLAPVVGNPVVNIREKAIVGSPNYPYSLDCGSVYGGGKGQASGDEDIAMLTGNPTVNIFDGHIYNKVFGGGQLANVNGLATVNMIGGYVGHQVLDETLTDFDSEYHYYPESNSVFWKPGVTAEVIDKIGRVFGGGEGIFIAGNATEMDKRGKVKRTAVNVSGGMVYANVYGGGNLGKVEGEDGEEYSTDVNITGGIVQHRAFGGGRGVMGNDNKIYDSIGDVVGNTRIRLSGEGKVKVCLYGGGETANVEGDAYVTLSGGEVGRRRTLAQIKAQPTHCNVFGAGKGDPHAGNYNLWTNVKNTHVDISDSTRIFGSVYGGGEDGHVLNDIHLDFHLGNPTDSLGTHGYSGVDGNIYSAGCGFNAVAPTAGGTGGNIYSNTYGKGRILGNIYGGGRIASAGVCFHDLLKEDTGAPEHGFAGDTVADVSSSQFYGRAFVNVGGQVIIGHEYAETTAAEDPDGPAVYLVGDIGGNVFGGAKGFDKSFTEYTYISGNTTTDMQARMGFVKMTEVTVKDTVTVLGSVYGGGEAGRVWLNSKVVIEGMAVIGQPRGDMENPLTDEELEKLNFSGNVYGGSWGSNSAYYAWQADTLNGTSGHEFNYLIRKDVGRVYGNTEVVVRNTEKDATWLKPTIYNSVYGGGAYASVGHFTPSIYNTSMGDVPDSPRTGQTLLKIEGGNIGPIDGTGHNASIFGGGKGMYDNQNQTKLFGQVFSTHVVVSDSAHIFGSVFGGGEDGDVLGNSLIDVTGGYIGTNGQTTWDGNIFGGGRNFHAGLGETVSHEAVGRLGGNVTINIRKGRMLGSVFGGGRFGSVGINDNGDTISGLLNGYVTVNVGGMGQTGDIDIGHTAYHDHDRVGGNVYGGGKGTAGPPNSFFTKLAKVKEATVNIAEGPKGDKEDECWETWIEGAVFGSGEDGHVMKNTYVNISGGQIGGKDYHTNPNEVDWCNDIYHGNVYGGGRGVDTYVDDNGDIQFSQSAGKVYGNTNVNITGGRIVRNVYGGGNLASVGVDIVATSGLATVKISGGTIGTEANNSENYGNVFGSGHGGSGVEFVPLAFVKNTHVVIDSVAQIYGSVFGGGEDGHVRENTFVEVMGGTIGKPDNTIYNGNVYGGGRGITTDVNGNLSPSAGEVHGYSRVDIKQSQKQTGSKAYYTPTVWNNVYGGGSSSVVNVYKMVNVSDGCVKGSVFGGSREVPQARSNKAPRFLNMWGGTVEGDIHGCSFHTTDGDPAKPKNWASFVNMSGGTVYGNVYGAGFGGYVKGSVGVLIGKNAIEKAPVEIRTADSIIPDEWKTTGGILNVKKSKLDIRGSVYAGSNYFGAPSVGYTWREFDITGYSNVYIDGKGYNTASNNTEDEDYMNIGTGLFGSGTHCEAGQEGRNIVFRNYGQRNMFNGGDDNDTTNDTLTSVTRTLTTIQRVGNLLLDSVNIALTGARDLVDHDHVETLYGMFIIDTSLIVSNGSAIVLGTDAQSANIDSTFAVSSVRLNESAYAKFFLRKLDMTWIGVKDMVAGEETGLNANLYYNHEPGHVLDRTYEENVILFNGASRLFVRYDISGVNQYGELSGFFRMSSPFKPKGLESFAYARKKVTPSSKEEPVNTIDGGFVSYHAPYNFFTDNGATYTKEKQYPYTNVKTLVTNTVFDYRMWVIPEYKGRKRWYVDGVHGIDGNAAIDGRGLYPDKPMKTVQRILKHTVGDEPIFRFDPEDCVIYVVDTVRGTSEWKEHEVWNPVPNGKLNFKYVYHSGEPDEYLAPEYQVQLVRYPGGHLKSDNETFDQGEIGPYYGPLVVQDTMHPLYMQNVHLDGLGEYSSTDSVYHEINMYVGQGGIKYNPANNNAPLVVINNDCMVRMLGENLTHDPTRPGTRIDRGFNNIDASGTIGGIENYYLNIDYNGNANNGGGVYTGGTLQVEGLVKVVNNRQKNGTGSIESNVYLPTFNKYVEISDTLSPLSSIGITNPIRNNDPRGYLYNTFSPVAVGVRSGYDDQGHRYDSIDAFTAWINGNFTDDQSWFFGKGYRPIPTAPVEPHSIYYSDTIPDYPVSETGFVPNKTLFHGWTWVNVVRSKPDGYVEKETDTIKSAEGLAWFISKVNGTNGQTPSTFNNKTVRLVANPEAGTDGNYDLNRYVWVPIGKDDRCRFNGTFDGEGHLINNLQVRYMGKGDVRYERSFYGMFGNAGTTVNEAPEGKITRTFLTSGNIAPEGAATVGGLVGELAGTLSESESAVTVTGNGDRSSGNGFFIGGLVGKLMERGTVRSSMCVSQINTIGTHHWAIGGLVGLTDDHATVYNSFAHIKFTAYDVNSDFGGLVGDNRGNIANCYMGLRGNLPEELTSHVFGLLVGDPISQHVYHSFGPHIEGYKLSNQGDGFCMEDCGRHTGVIDSDTYGYMYSDNVAFNGTEADTALFGRLNKYVASPDGFNGASEYARWARPTLAKINGDLPVLLLEEGADYQGEFSSVGTYAGGPALQYGGPVRDKNQLSTMLGRKEHIFVYGDITEDLEGVTVTADSVAIYEHAAIMKPGALGSYGNTFVGVSFDNTSRRATDFYGNTLHRDWHMFSTPLNDAPLGINYQGQNTNDPEDENYHQYNHWDGDELPGFDFYAAATAGGNFDGYFPSKNPARKPTDKYAYPYDFYCWYEPDWQWINFKRNGPSHWHYDYDSEHDHPHIDYQATPGATENVNETTLVPGKGYQLAIHEDTYMQSHGNLNNTEVEIKVVNSAGVDGLWGVGPLYTGNNLIGNPYHAYLDFKAFGGDKITSYYVYDADTAKIRNVNYLIYPDGGSTGGCYASQYLHPHQGFFIQTSDAQTLTFTPDMTVTRTEATNATFREWQPAYPLVNLFAYDQENRGDVVVIEFNRPENGGGKKAKALRNGNHLVFAHYADDDYGAFFAKLGTKQVPVRFQSFETVSTPYTLKWDLHNADIQAIYLMDNLTGATCDMLENDSYSFVASKFDYLSRFKIVFSLTDLEEYEDDQTFAFYDGNSWVVNGKGRLELVDVTGRILYTNNLSGDQSRVDLSHYAKGIYLLRLWEGNRFRVQKIVMY